MDVQHGTVAGTDNGLVLQDGNLGIEHLSHVAGEGGVTQNEARRDVLGFGRSTDKHYICSDKTAMQICTHDDKLSCTLKI